MRAAAEVVMRTTCDVLRQLVGRAKAGDPAAAQLLLCYLVSQPVDRDPDR
jgi:hypothetical protein